MCFSSQLKTKVVCPTRCLNQQFIMSVIIVIDVLVGFLGHLKEEYHGSAHVLAEANVTIYKPIGSSDDIIRAGNLHEHVKISLVLSSLVIA